MSILEGPLVFVDIETTGMSYSRGRIIEVAAIRVEDGEVISSFNSLVDPDMPLPTFISSLTGITDSDVTGAPSFYDIADDLVGIMDGAVFIAHNVRFDYGFLKHEFRRVGKQFNPKLLCTVKLSKALYPGLRGHKLQDLIEWCGIEVSARHRAYDDAAAMWQFLQHSKANFPAPLIEAAIKLQLKSPALPKNLSPDSISELPEQPGVYIFKDDNDNPLYIGKSVNIKKRVLSHFSADHEHNSELKISQQVSRIESKVTGGELEALLLESMLVKDMQPLYNRQLRRRQKLTLARKRLNPDGYITIVTDDVAEIDPAAINDILGVYSTKGRAQQFMGDIIKNFGLCPRLMGLEKGRGPCFSHQLKRCLGACCGAESADLYNARLLTAFEGSRLRDWPYKSPVIITEKSDTDALSSIIVDRWCVIAHLNQQPDCEPVIQAQDKMFDIDTYKILRSFLSSKIHKLNIRPISRDKLNELMSVGIV